MGGKGGVGKTTTAAALAVSLADSGREVLVLSVDPAHSLGDALEVQLGPDPVAVPGVPRLRAMEIDASREQARFLDSHRGALLRLLDRGSYLDRDDVDSFVDLALPGADELAALFRLMELASAPDSYVVVDTAPTGHTLRLLDLPRVARGWLAGLEAMEEKHRLVSLGLAGAYRPDETAALLSGLAADLDRLAALLADPEATRVVLVTNPDPVVLAETRRYVEALSERSVALAGIVVNRAGPDAAAEGTVYLPRLPRDPRGAEALRRFAASATPAPAGLEVEPGAAGATPAPGAPFRAPADRLLYLVGGKGGVGKSTVASALALQLARERRVLLLGVDPAGSLGDVLGIEVGAEATPVPGAPGLRVRQLEAESAWRSFQREYRAETEELLSGLVGGGSAEADRRVLERLLDLAPPGIDELMTLVQVVDLTEDRPYDALVLDTAPTGHLLRLLELPGVALEWTRAVLRMLLKYREVMRLGGLAERLLALSRDLRGLRELLADPRSTWFLAVALPEALGVPETRRLLAGVRAVGVEPAALLVNRHSEGAEVNALLALDASLPVAAAPHLAQPPVGVAALTEFAASWRVTERPH